MANGDELQRTHSKTDSSREKYRMEVKSYSYSSVYLLSSIFCSLIILLFVTTTHLSFYASSSSKNLIAVAARGLQTMVINSDRMNAVRSSNTSFFDGLRSSSVTSKISKRKSGEEELEQGLARARASILEAASRRQNFSLLNSHGSDAVHEQIYRNSGAFYRSYEEMEKRFKVFVYSEGDPPIVHDGPCKDIYSIEGRFIREMEHGEGKFVTVNPENAHVFFLPFSVTWMVKYLYGPLTLDQTPLTKFVADYVRLVSLKYPFWNRTLGADHFMLACHDWGPHASGGNEVLYKRSIRVLCNANSSEGFDPTKDVALPEIHLYGGQVSPRIRARPPRTAQRPYLAFFSGGKHGPIRALLLRHWKGRDRDLPVFQYLPDGPDRDQYYAYMLASRYCLCPSGHEVASPRIVEAIYAECVPVILSDHYVLPFSDVLRWEAFSVSVPVSEISRLKDILRSIPEANYARLRDGLRSVRLHFVLNRPARRFDVFHMILHSIWLRRINLRLS